MISSQDARNYCFLLLATTFVSNHYEVDWLPAFGVCYSFYLVVMLLFSLGKVLPIIEMTLALMAIQLIAAPYADYHYFHNDIFGIMVIGEKEYFDFVIPCMLLMHLGIRWGLNNKDVKLSLPNLLNKIASKQAKYVQTGNVLIVIGYFAHIVERFPIPSALSFIVYIIAFFRFVGFFYVWSAGSKFTKWYFVLVFVPFYIEVVRSAIFIDGIVWSFFLLSFYAIRTKVSLVSISFFAVFGLTFLFLLQAVKGEYRVAVWDKKEDQNQIAMLWGLMTERAQTMDTRTLKLLGGLAIVRVNQGWILTDIMQHIPRRQPDVAGKYFYEEVVGVFLPRLLMPNKAQVGSHEKFDRFTGWHLNLGVAMNVGIMGDGYGNFGWWGGLVYCLFFGLLVGKSLGYAYTQIQKYPTALFWAIIIFFYVMRAGNETYIIVNWIFKSSLIVWFYFYVYESRFKIYKKTKVSV
jgi:hypothetical protein